MKKIKLNHRVRNKTKSNFNIKQKKLNRRTWLKRRLLKRSFGERSDLMVRIEGGTQTVN